MTGARESPEVAPTGMTSVYVYGVVRADARATPARVVTAGGLAAAVADVPADWRSAGRAEVEAHDRVLSELSRHTTVVPLRFGTVMASDDEVRERLLERHADEIEALLRQLEGRLQMSVKAFYLEETLLRRLLHRRPELKRRSQALEGLPIEATQQQRIALGRDVADGLQEQRALDERMIVDALAPFADDVRVEPPVSDRHAATVQLLVAADRREALDAAVDRLAVECDGQFAVRYVGPIPPYSFSDLSLEERAEQWA